MDYLVIALAALLASALTLFSGFGLGTLLMPVVAIFFPVDIAIGITAVVHFANNLFKLGLLGLRADRSIVIAFGIPAVVLAFVGAWLLSDLARADVWFGWSAFGHDFTVFPVNAVIGALILVFVILELMPFFARLSFGQRWLPVGGMLSGFFGGLSGHQGAFRSMFLLKSGMSAERFIATNIVIAVLVDMARLSIYGRDAVLQAGIDWSLVMVATLAAFVGAFIGSRLMKKITIETVRVLVSFLLVALGIGLVGGLL